MMLGGSTTSVKYGQQLQSRIKYNWWNDKLRSSRVTMQAATTNDTPSANVTKPFDWNELLDGPWDPMNPEGINLICEYENTGQSAGVAAR